MTKRLDGPSLRAELDQEGCAVLPAFLSERQAGELAALPGSAGIDREAPPTPRDPGFGERFYLPRPLPPIVADLRAFFYGHLAPFANRWNEVLGEPQRFPDSLEAFLRQRGGTGEVRSRSHVHRLRAGEYQALHPQGDASQDFPLQLVALLSEPGEDFTGGELVMVEQRPRMQSRPLVLPLRKGDLAIVTSAERPHKGARGYYRVRLKHAISRVRSGERVGLAILFDVAG